MSENPSNMAGVRGSPSGSYVPSRSAFPVEAKIYHEKNGAVSKVDPLWKSIEKLLSSGRFRPNTSVDQYNYGRFVVEDFRIRVVRKVWQPNQGYSWAETIVYVMGDE